LKSKSVRYEQTTPGSAHSVAQRLRPLLWTIPSLITVCAMAAAWFYTHDDAPRLTGAAPAQAFFAQPVVNTWRVQFDAAPASTSANASPLPHGSTAEAMVEHVYALFRQGERSAALQQTQRLTANFPNFQLGQLLYAELLNEGLAQPIDPKEIPGKETASGQDRYDELLLESNRRLNRPAVDTLKGLVPSNIISLSTQNPYLIAVDASKSRLYWFANKTVDPLKPRLELLLDTYVSVGQKGTGKLREGDGRTPLGVYFVNKNLKGQPLPDLYGAGALTLNYPNAIDVMRGQTGSGIWLHGTPSAQYARAPWATDGCVVMSNPEMDRLLSLKNLEKTPVLITDKLEWVSSDRSVPDREAFQKTLKQWIHDRQTSNLDSLKNLYSPQYQRDGKGLSAWWPEIAAAAQVAGHGGPVNLLSVLHWKDTQDYIVVNVSNPNTPKSKAPQQLRMYWTKEGNQWQILYEGPV
jgi:L,D-transpeptidase YnhG